VFLGFERMNRVADTVPSAFRAGGIGRFSTEPERCSGEFTAYALERSPRATRRLSRESNRGLHPGRRCGEVTAAGAVEAVDSLACAGTRPRAWPEHDRLLSLMARRLP